MSWLNLPYIYGDFRDDLIFAFSPTSFKSQIIEYAEIILFIIFYKKLFKSQDKWLTQIKNATRKNWIYGNFKSNIEREKDTFTERSYQLTDTLL